MNKRSSNGLSKQEICSKSGFNPQEIIDCLGDKPSYSNDDLTLLLQLKQYAASQKISIAQAFEAYKQSQQPEQPIPEAPPEIGETQIALVSSLSAVQKQAEGVVAAYQKAADRITDDARAALRAIDDSILPNILIGHANDLADPQLERMEELANALSFRAPEVRRIAPSGRLQQQIAAICGAP